MITSRCKRKSTIDWEVDYLFVKTGQGKAECIVCGKKTESLKLFNLFRHYNTRHKNVYANYSNNERQALLESYKMQINSRNQTNGTMNDSLSSITNDAPSLSTPNDQFMSSPDLTPSTSTASVEVLVDMRQSLAASYAVAWEIGKKKKPFSDGEFVKNCAITMAKAFGNTTAMEQFKTVSLSHQTISRRIGNLNTFLEKELHILIDKSVYFSLCLDESNDISDTSQLLIFIRTVGKDFVANEELLALHPMHGTTKGNDIFNGVITEVQKYTTFEKCSCIVTDGAPAMVGIDNGFVGMLRKNNIQCTTLHCIIHQEALCAKSLKLISAMDLVVKVTNLIRGGNRSLSHRKLKSFLNEVDAAYGDLLLHCEVRWLSAGKCLQRFFSLRKEIPVFLKAEVKRNTDDMEKRLRSYDFLCELAFLTDITSHMNDLNLKLQGKNQNIANLFGHIVGFRKKLDLFKGQIEGNQLFHFPCCAEIRSEYPEANYAQFCTDISAIVNSFNTRFLDFEPLRSDIELFVNPLTAKIDEQKHELQLELCDLQADMYFANIKETGENFFKLLPVDKFPKLRDFGLRMYSMFGSTYICECTFSSMKQIKCSSRTSLSDSNLLAELRIATTKISLSIPDIISKEKNLQNSH